MISVSVRNSGDRSYKRRFRGDFRQIRIVRALRHVREHDVTRLSVKAVDQPFRDVFIRQMAEPRKDSLLQFPRIIFDGLQHVAAVVRFDHDRRATAQSFA